jgi:hypothetical protein
MTTEAEALVNILEWSAECPGWQRDALRRLATQATLELAEVDELRRPQPVDRPEAAWRRYGGRASCSQVRGLVLALAHRPDRTRHRARHWSIGI